MIENIENITERLADENTTFAAVPKNALANEEVTLLYHKCGQNAKLQQYLDAIDEVIIADTELPFTGARNVRHTDIHFVNRVPVYAMENPSLGLDVVPREDGLTNLREFVATNQEPAPSAGKTVDIHTLLVDLIDAGAAAIGLDIHLFRWSEEELVALTVYLQPVIGAEVVSDYNAVEIDGRVFDLSCEFVTDESDLGIKAILFASDSILGLESVSPEETLPHLGLLLSKVGKKPV